MHLYNLTLQKPSVIIKVLYGSFTGSKPAKQVLICKTKSLELYRIDEQGKLIEIVVQELFCVLRSAVAFRWQGIDHDLIIISSDSGKVIILQFNQNKGCFVKTHQETFGKTGCRRIVPGQYLAIDPKGRAFMIAAIEKEKFAYSFDRQSDKLVLQSPKDAHKSYVLYLDVIGLDTGNENPQFACIQVDYGDVQQKDSLVNKGGVLKNMVTYMMNFGQNILVRKKAVVLPPSAHMLIPVPNEPDGPGGVFIVCENFILYKNQKIQKGLPIPRRKDRPIDRQVMITNYVLHKQKDQSFFLIQNQLGDIFKLTFTNSDKKVEYLIIQLQYFDTIAPSVSMCLSRNGYLFCAGQRSDHVLYVNKTGEQKTQVISTTSNQSIQTIIEFVPKQLQNLEQKDRLQSFSSLTDIKVEDMTGEGVPQIYLLNGAGSRSSLKVVRQGLPIKEIGSVPLPKSQSVWTLKSSVNDKYHSYIFISMISSTMTLLVNQSGKVSQAKIPGIKYQVPSLHIGMFQDGSILQVFNTGFKHITRNKVAKQTTFSGQILRATNNMRQMALALRGGQLLYYQINQSGDLDKKHQKTPDQHSEATCLDIGPIPPGRQRCNFLAVGLSDHTCRVLDLSPDKSQLLTQLSRQKTPSSIESVAIIEMINQQVVEQELSNQLYLYMGLSDGEMIRSTIDIITGNLSDTRKRSMGVKPVKIIKSIVHGSPALIALSSRAWLIYNYMKKYMTSLLSYKSLEDAAPFVHSNVDVGLIGISGALKVLSVQKLGVLFHSEKYNLDYSPRKMITSNGQLIILEYDQRRFSIEKQNQIRQNLNLNRLPSQQIGQPFANQNQYSGLIRIFDPRTKEHKVISLQHNQICISICGMSVTNQDKNVDKCMNFVCVGVVKGYKNKPSRSFEEAFINVYGWNQLNQLVFLHSTKVEDMPFALHGWQQKIIAGIGASIRAYQIGKKKLLKKAQMKSLHSPVNAIFSQGERIYTTQIGDSFHVYKFKGKDQTFYDIADDILPRYTTSSALLDYHTMIGADKFQNIYVSRTPPNTDEDFQNNPNSYKFRWENGYLNGAPFKMQQICSFYVGQVVTSMQKASLTSSSVNPTNSSNSSQIIIYCTINGSICALYPFKSPQDIDFFTHLQMFMRAEISPLGGRDHLGYRSFHGPCKGVIDGDLCEIFEKQPYEVQVKIAKYMDRTPEEVHKRLQSIRNHIL